ncbi:MAG: hypothetical protein ND895_16165 [Pyrinomonadaceae bacterium]|nr:hypothetical protein [Pyrinomonadaceae bacterium]
MKPLPFAVGVLVLTLTCGDTTSALKLHTHISSRSNGEALSASHVQDLQMPLTNDDVIKMFGAGLTESTIVQVIQKVPANFDTSPDALIKLKQQGVTAKIIEAMVAAKPTLNSSAPTETGASSRGVFAQNGPAWRRIEEVSSIEVRSVGNISSAVTMGIKETRLICVFRGEKAELQLDNRRPVFRVAGLGASTRDVYIVAMRLNPDRRDLEMGRSGLVKKLSYGFRKRDVRDVDVKRLGDDLLEVTPKQDLEPGEYIMVLGGVATPVSVPGSRSGRSVMIPGSRGVMIPSSGPVGMSAGTEGTTGYDFGIVAATKVASK